MLDGDPVYVGDTVFDRDLGTGVVMHTTPDGAFTVKFGNARQKLYQRDGMFNNKKQVYWRDPVIMLPRKNNRAQQEFIMHMATAAAEYFGTAISEGQR